VVLVPNADTMLVDGAVYVLRIMSVPITVNHHGFTKGDLVHGSEVHIYVDAPPPAAGTYTMWVELRDAFPGLAAISQQSSV
jgi:hypothetical protein